MDNILSKLAIDTIKVNDYLYGYYPKGEIVDVYVFGQVWGSTSLGFGGWGGSTMTHAWTHVVLTSDGCYNVFFGGSFAYSVKEPNEEFKKDLSKNYMKSVKEALTLYNTKNN